MTKPMYIALIGYKFMGKAHSNAFRQVKHFFPDVPFTPVMKTICGRTEASVKEACEQFGWEKYETSWEHVVKDPEIQLVDISTGNDTHLTITEAAAAAGKHVYCEKPLARNLQEARKMLQVVEKAKVKHAISFNYRFVPGLAFIRKMVDEGKLGTIYHFRGTYLQDWIMDPNFPLVWRLDKSQAGSGVLGDLCAHTIDIARFLVGEFDSVVGLQETFIKERPTSVGDMDGGLGAKGASGETHKVDVDDTTSFLCRFSNGAVGTIEATRFAGGRRNYNRFEINGSKGSVVFCMEKPNQIEYYNAEDPEGYQGFRTILTTEAAHPYAGNWWPSAHNIGYEHTFIHLVHDMLVAINNNQLPVPNFVDGVKAQEVMEAVELSAKEKRWIEIKELGA